MKKPTVRFLNEPNMESVKRACELYFELMCRKERDHETLQDQVQRKQRDQQSR